MSKFKIYNGTTWVDPCDCNVNIRTTSNTWQKLDPANCPTYYWTGTQWCPIVCECNCIPGYTLNVDTGLCEQNLFATPTYSQDHYTISMGGQSGQYCNQDAVIYSEVSPLFTLPIIGYKTGVTYNLFDSTPIPGAPIQLAPFGTINDIIYKGTSVSNGFLNTKGIWANKAGSPYPNNQTLTLSYCVNPTEPSTYIVAMSGTGEMTVKLDPGTGPITYINLTGATSPTGPNLTTVYDLYRYAHIVPINVPAGSYTFYFEINNYGFSSPAFAVELYKSDLVTFGDITSNTPIDQTALDAITVFSSRSLLDRTSIIADPLDSPGTFTCPVNYSLSEDCYGTPMCVQYNEYPCGGTPEPPPVITSRTEINIWFDNSGSMGSTLTPLQTMRDTLLQACLLPVYNNDLALYNQRVKVLNFDDDPLGYERFIHLLATDKNFDRAVDTTVDQVINLTFADESDSYGYGNSFAFDNTQRNGNLTCPASPYCGTYDTDIANLRSVLATSSTLIKGCAFRVNTGPGSYPGFRGLTEATFVNTGVYAVPYNVSDYVGTNFSYQLDVTAGSTPAYYLSEVVAGLNSLGFVLTC